MTDNDTTTDAGKAAGDQSPQLDPAFFTCVNEYLDVCNRQSKQHGLKRTSVAGLYAAARFNSHVFLAHLLPGDVAGERKDFLDYMTSLYRRMLNEHLDGLGAERGLDVGESELAAEYAAAKARPRAAEEPPAP